MIEELLLLEFSEKSSGHFELNMQ